MRGRFGNRWLALAVSITGIVATMPYIALQLVGIQVVIGGLGISGSGFTADLPLIIAFVILAAFTYSSGLRAPASIAIVKDILIYVTAFAAVIVIPSSSAVSAISLQRFPRRSCCSLPQERIRLVPIAPTRPWRLARRLPSSSTRIRSQEF